MPDAMNPYGPPHERSDSTASLAPPNPSPLAVASRTMGCVLAAGATLGGGLISIGGLFVQSEVRFVLVGLGGGLLVWALWIMKVSNRNAWPADQA